MSEAWTIRRVLTWTTGHFEKKDVDAPRLTAELLLSHVLGCTRVRLYVDLGSPAPAGGAHPLPRPHRAADGRRADPVPDRLQGVLQPPLPGGRAGAHPPPGDRAAGGVGPAPPARGGAGPGAGSLHRLGLHRHQRGRRAAPGQRLGRGPLPRRRRGGPHECRGPRRGCAGHGARGRPLRPDPPRGALPRPGQQPALRRGG